MAVYIEEERMIKVGGEKVWEEIKRKKMIIVVVVVIVVEAAFLFF